MVIGFLLAILTGVCYGLQGTYGKVLAKSYPSPVLTWAIFTFTTPFILLFVVIFGIPEINWFSFAWATTTSIFVNVIAWNLFFRALAVSPLSLTMPFTAFTPLFLIPIALVILGELPDLWGTIGIFLIIFGAYGLHLDATHVLQPFRNMFREKGTRYMLIVALIWGISAAVEKVAILNSSPEFYGVVIHLLLSLAYLPYVLRRHPAYLQKINRHLVQFLWLGVISGFLVIFQFSALKYLFVSYVIAFKRVGIIISVILGYFLFRESNILRNLISTTLMVIGVLLIMH